MTEDGQVKILDFGLAKLTGQTRLTKTGRTVGTVAYMSPEQIRGGEIDHRTDIWSFGATLYEMLTGRLPFEGDYEQAMIYSIVNENPAPVTGMRTGVPLELERIIGKALEKRSDDRYQHVDEMLVDLRRLKRDTDKIPVKAIEAGEISAETTERPRIPDKGKPLTSRLVLVAFAAVAITVIIILLFFSNLLRRAPVRQIQTTHRQITFTGKAALPAISPDGKSIAYVSETLSNEEEVLVQDLSGGQPLEVFNGRNISSLDWSPDGSELIINARIPGSAGGSYLASRFGGPPRRFIYSAKATWSPDGSHFAGYNLGARYIWFTNKITGEETSIFIDGSYNFILDIDWSPVADLILFQTRTQRIYTIWTINLDGSGQHKVFEDSVDIYSPSWSSKGDAIYYLRTLGLNRNLMKISVNPETGEAKGPARAIQTGLLAGSSFTLSGDNRSLLYTRRQMHTNIWLVNYNADNDTIVIKTEQLTTGTSVKYGPRISPDGKRIAFAMGDPSNSNIFTMPIEGGPIKQLTFLNSFNVGPVWSPNGNELAFSSTQDGTPKVWRVSSEGGTPRPFDNSDLSATYEGLIWSPGTDILYQRPGNRNYHFLNPETEKEHRIVDNDSVGWMFYPCYSPDSKMVAVAWNRTPVRGIWLISLDDSSQVSSLQWGYGTIPVPLGWSRDGEWIYAWEKYEKFPEILMISLDGGESKKLLTLPFEDIQWISLSQVANKLACSVYESQSDVWFMEDFDPDID